MELVTKCYSCGYEIVFAAGENTCRCEACGRTNGRPKSQKNELELMKYSNERLSFGEFDEAENGYRKVLQRTPDEHEARWGLLLCKYGVRYVEDVKTGQRLPTCRRALPTSFVAEPDFRLACEAAPPEVRAQYEKDGKYIDDIQKEIRRLKATGEKYDIFLCYKETDGNGRRTRDSMLAQNLYQTLTLHGFSAFFAPISLKKCLGANYEAAIFCAVESARVMLVLATKPEYLETTWVRSEWKRYIERIDMGEDKLLIPLYRDFSPDCLPREFNDRFLQGLNMGNFTFISDLEAFLQMQLDVGGSDAEESKQQSSLLKRGFMELEDGDFEAARECFDEVLDGEPENPRANLGMAMVELKACDEDMLAEACAAREDWKSLKYIRRFRKYGDDEDRKQYERLCREAEDIAAEAAERRAKEEARRRAEAEARRKAEEEAHRKAAEEEARRKAEEEARRRAAEEARRKTAEEEARRKAEEEARRKAAEEEARRKEEEERRRAEALRKTYGDYTWENDGDGIKIIKYNGNAENVVIPGSIDGKPVRTIGRYAFCGCDSLKSVRIPEGVTTISDTAFAFCSSLTSVTIPESVTTIDGYVFSECRNLTSVTIPKGVTTIGRGAFLYCVKLTSATIPEGVATIGGWAFKDCHNIRIRVSADSPIAAQLKEEYGDKVEYLTGKPSASHTDDPAKRAVVEEAIRRELQKRLVMLLKDRLQQHKDKQAWFQEMLRKANEQHQRKELLLEKQKAAQQRIQSAQKPPVQQKDAASAQFEYFRVSGVNGVTIKGYRGTDGDVRVPDTIDGLAVTAIGKGAFAGKLHVWRVVLPESVRVIDDEAFKGCDKLETVLLRPGLKTIGASAFEQCGVLTCIDIPGSVTSIGEKAFFRCAALKTITIPNGVGKIANSTFASCAKLQRVELPPSVTHIGWYAFASCESLAEVSLPDKLEILGMWAFTACKNLRKITIPAGVEKISTGTFAECASLRDLRMPQRLKSVEEDAFRNCRSLGTLTVSRLTQVKPQGVGSPKFKRPWFG